MLPSFGKMLLRFLKLTIFVSVFLVLLSSVSADTCDVDDLKVVLRTV